MSELTELTRQAVRDSFPGLIVSHGGESGGIITIPPVHPEFGALEVLDDEDELTVHCGRFTHVHLSNYDEGISREERHRRIVARFVEFLRNVFADQYEFWGSHRGGGGCRLRGTQGLVSRVLIGEAAFTWSGPIKCDPTE